jgi:hypothetical protein
MFALGGTYWDWRNGGMAEWHVLPWEVA